MSTFPLQRLRRLRRHAGLRTLRAETHLRAGMLMQPYFVVDGQGRREPIAAMPGIKRLSVDALVARAQADVAAGLRQILLFGVVPAAAKDGRGSAADRASGVVATACAALRRELGDAVVLATDVCLCGYTDHGHCGLLAADGSVDNDASLPRLCSMACCHAQAGADLVAPSDMMDGRVQAIRAALDGASRQQVGIMAYAAKYASAYYGPFRDAAASAPGHGDRRSYQLDPRNLREALAEVDADVAEGADMVMVKPALAYLDVVARVRQRTLLPLACYNVSGEYSMVHAAAAQGLVDGPRLIMENLTAMARAGADVLITYHAHEVLHGGWLADA